MVLGGVVGNNVPDACRPSGAARRRHGQAWQLSHRHLRFRRLVRWQASRDAIHAEAEDHIFDELKDWIDALPDWDGVVRSTTGLRPTPAPTRKAHRRSIWPWSARSTSCRCSTARSTPVPRPTTRCFSSPSRGLARTAYSRRCSRPTTARVFRHQESARPISPLVLPERSSRTAPKCRLGAKSDVEERKEALTRCVDHGRRGLRLRGALLSAAHLPRLLVQRCRFLPGRDRQSAVLALRRDP